MIEQLMDEMCRVAHIAYERNLFSGNDGNISIRLDDHRMLVTPSGINKGFIKPGDLLVQSFDGKVLEGNKKPTREAMMHYMIYKNRPNVGAVLHAHPAYSTAFAVKGQVLPEDALTEVKHVIGKIGLVGQALPGSIELAEKVAECAIGHDNIFIEKHGVLICAQTLFDAFCTMDAIENASKSIILSKLL